MMLLLLGLLGCGVPAVQQPVETCVVVPVQPSPVDLREATDAFERWVETSVRTPGAIFRVLRLGRARAGVQTAFVEVVPQSWGAPNAVANKRAFVTRIRQRFRELIARSGAGAVNVVLPPTSKATVEVLPRMDSRGMRWTWNAGPKAHTATVCDVSPSVQGSACTPASLLESYDVWASQAITVGSSYRVWIVGASIATAKETFEIDTPDLLATDRIAYLLSARNELEDLFNPLPAHTGSAVAGAITAAVSDLAPRRGVKTLRILSDLRETSDAWAFDQRVPEPQAFVGWLASERLLPDCRGIAISVCGLHYTSAEGQPPFDARRGAEIRDVWTEALSAMHPRALRMCGACDAEAFSNDGGDSMAPRGRKRGEREAAQIGTNRGGHAFVDHVPADTGEVIHRWQFFDPKRGRAAHLAGVVRAHFPRIKTEAHEADGREVVSRLPETSLVISTVDTVETTRALVRGQRPGQTLIFQLVGRGPGPAVAAGRLGLSGVVHDPDTQAQAGLLLDGFATISAAASSRALTSAGDPMSAALLQPMRLTATRQSARYFSDLLHGSELADAPLTFFTSAGRYPLAVAADRGEGFHAQKAHALSAVEGIGLHRTGIIAAVALVALEERSIDVLFVSRNRTDQRRVEGVTTFRAPSQRYTSSAVFTD
jgi:hypothetical protein